jgi:transmembrane sensor
MIEAAAAAWLSLRDRGMSPAETAEFVSWLQQDPQHAATFAELDAVWKDFDRLGAVPAPAPASAHSSAPLPTPDADLLAPRARPRLHRTLTWTAAALGAAVAIAFLLLAVSHFRTPRHTAETAVGAFQKLDLPDGTVAQLNTDSAIDTAFTATERRVRIVRGEVFFSVTKDPARPFIVTAGAVAVRAVGTAFNVRQRADAVEVLVTEGRVRVDDARAGRSLLPANPASAAPATEPPLLVAGERATVPVAALATSSAATPAPATTVTVEKVAPPAAQRALAWQERRLEFDAVPLAEVVREFNRYNLRQLVIADATLAAKRFSGTFRADSYESLVRLLETDFAVIATRTDREIVLRSGR